MEKFHRCSYIGKMTNKTNKLGQTDLVFGFWTEFISRVVCTWLLVSALLWFVPPWLMHTHTDRQLSTGYVISSASANWLNYEIPYWQFLHKLATTLDLPAEGGTAMTGNMLITWLIQTLFARWRLDVAASVTVSTETLEWIFGG